MRPLYAWRSIFTSEEMDMKLSRKVPDVNDGTLRSLLEVSSHTKAGNFMYYSLKEAGALDRMKAIDQRYELYAEPALRGLVSASMIFERVVFCQSKSWDRPSSSPRYRTRNRLCETRCDYCAIQPPRILKSRYC